MDRRGKSEQFRKTRNNYFKRGFKIGDTSEAELWVVMKRKDKFFTFMNTDNPLPSQAEIDYSIAIAKTAADYQTSSRATSDQSSALSALSVRAPTAPQLELGSQRRSGGWKKVIFG